MLDCWVDSANLAQNDNVIENEFSPIEKIMNENRDNRNEFGNCGISIDGEGAYVFCRVAFIRFSLLCDRQKYVYFVFIQFFFHLRIKVPIKSSTRMNANGIQHEQLFIINILLSHQPKKGICFHSNHSFSFLSFYIS